MDSDNDIKPNTLPKGARVQLHAATDYWMQGDRYGTVTGYGHRRMYRDSTDGSVYFMQPVRVRLDVSGRTVRVHPSNLYLIDN